MFGPYLPALFTIFPSFITKETRSVAVMSVSGIARHGDDVGDLAFRACPLIPKCRKGPRRQTSRIAMRRLASCPNRSSGRIPLPFDRTEKPRPRCEGDRDVKFTAFRNILGTCGSRPPAPDLHRRRNRIQLFEAQAIRLGWSVQKIGAAFGDSVANLQGFAAIDPVANGDFRGIW